MPEIPSYFGFHITLLFSFPLLTTALSSPSPASLPTGQYASDLLLFTVTCSLGDLIHSYSCIYYCHMLMTPSLYPITQTQNIQLHIIIFTRCLLHISASIYQIKLLSIYLLFCIPLLVYGNTIHLLFQERKLKSPFTFLLPKNLHPSKQAHDLIQNVAQCVPHLSFAKSLHLSHPEPPSYITCIFTCERQPGLHIRITWGTYETPIAQSTPRSIIIY